MKADLIGKLIGRDDARATEEIAELARICATARADVRLVAGEARELPLDAELAAARDVLASAGIDVRAYIGANPPQEAASVLVPVLREAVTNILKHTSASYCTLELTIGRVGQLRLQVSNDGSYEADSASLTRQRVPAAASATSQPVSRRQAGSWRPGGKAALSAWPSSSRCPLAPRPWSASPWSASRSFRASRPPWRPGPRPSGCDRRAW